MKKDKPKGRAADPPQLTPSDLSSFSEDELRNAEGRIRQRIRELEQDRQRRAIIVRGQLNARAAAHARTLLEIFEPEHAGNVHGDSEDSLCDMEDSCIRCALLYAAKHGEPIWNMDEYRVELTYERDPLPDPDETK